MAQEVEKYFETKVNPGTIYHKARRFQGGTNAPQPKNPTADGVSEEIKQIKREPAKDGTMRGGPREGAGRKITKPTIKEKDYLEVSSPRYLTSHKDLFDYLMAQERTGWPDMPKYAAIFHYEKMDVFILTWLSGFII